MRVVIVEDEKPAARRLKRMLESELMQVKTMLHSVYEAVEWFSNHEHPDLIFLDIQLSDGLSFEIFDRVEVRSPIIFTTAYDEYALKAFKLNSVDYLLKPIDPDELKQAIDKYRKHRGNVLGIDADMIRRMLDTNFGKSYKKRFTVKVGSHLKMIAVDEISCIFSAHKGTFLLTKSNREYPADATLEQLETQLDPERFFRINRKYLVAVSAITDIIAYSNSRLKLKINGVDADELIVSRDRVKAFRNWLQ